MTQMICEKAKDCPLGDPYCIHKEHHKENKDCANIVCYGTVCIPDPPAPAVRFDGEIKAIREAIPLMYLQGDTNEWQKFEAKLADILETLEREAKAEGAKEQLDLASTDRQAKP